MSISAVYYRKADGVILVFDVTKPRSFTNIETIWMNAVEEPDRYGRVSLYTIDQVLFISYTHYQYCVFLTTVKTDQS